jgi:hypothetical protein
MKKLLGSIVFASILLTSPGCALFRSGTTTEQKAADIKNLTYAAASIGGSIAVTDHPEWKPQFVQAYNTLDTLVKGNAVTGELLRQIVASLPVKELKSDKARIAIDGATMLFDATVGSSWNLEDQPYIVAAATGLRDGLKAGLGL